MLGGGSSAPQHLAKKVMLRMDADVDARAFQQPLTIGSHTDIPQS